MSATNANNNASDAQLPPLAALFLIKFDLKVGYTITWKRSVAGLDLDGAVEFKSLPSGLHSIKEDLVYFVHDRYVGLSAFINGPASEEERNAHLVAVGILVPLSRGRLGRSWLHAQKLRELAKQLVHDTTKTEPLEQYWVDNSADRNRIDEGVDSTPSSPIVSRPPPSVLRKNKTYASRNRGLSNITQFHPGHETLSVSHPALSIIKYIDTFGPLVFPLQRAALLRKRILFITTPPVRLSCEFVYDLSILSSIPSSVTGVLPPGSEPLHRLRSLFTVGVHDIPNLQDDAKKHEEAKDSNYFLDGGAWTPGWAACTTDEVLSIKANLYDIIVELPAQLESPAQEKRWPRIKTSTGKEIKATQRDMRRFRILHSELRKTQRHSMEVHRQDDHGGADSDDDSETDDDQVALLSRSRTESESSEDDIYADNLVEAPSWTALAYSGFMWWASAGERDSSAAEEADSDRALLGDLSDFMTASLRGSSDDAMAQTWYQGAGAPHTAIIAYFHRLTAEIFSTLGDLVDAADDEEGDDEEVEGEERSVVVHSEDTSRMGLDVWSETDKAFVKEVLAMYFGRRAEVHGASIECCGIKIC
ncbi:uncharacterized protein J3D65DRAFT_435843 [Phyllosticta citribraziliensis]|uniref:DUF4484 domain-containing protein n=1 Tax=Phyllosticta citribraziliensis TaxID=989973 RepID=A0ABR1LIL6_9PEZI